MKCEKKREKKRKKRKQMLNGTRFCKFQTQWNLHGRVLSSGQKKTRCANAHTQKNKKGEEKKKHMFSPCDGGCSGYVESSSTGIMELGQKLPVNVET